MSIFAFPATPKVTVLVVPSNLAEAHNFVGEKWNLCVGFRSMKYLSILALLALVILGLGGCAATTESYGSGTGVEGSTQ